MSTYPCTAPTAPPQNVAATSSDTSATSITVSWEPVPCLSRNSEITGYIVRYNEAGSSRATRADMQVSAPATSATLDGLTGLTQYSIQVAAVGAGETGPFSEAVTAETAAATTTGEWIESSMGYYSV